MSSLIKSLNLKNWRQYGEVDIEFHPRLTVITGENGSGKSTLIGIVSSTFGQEKQYFATPEKSKDGGYIYNTGINYEQSGDDNLRTVGRIVYAKDQENDREEKITVSPASGVHYSLSIVSGGYTDGIHIDTHAPVSSYRSVQQIPLNGISAHEAYVKYSGDIGRGYFEGGGVNSMFNLKECLISWAIFGEGNSSFQGNKSLKKEFDDYSMLLSQLFPQYLGYKKIEVRPPEVVIVTELGDYIIDASSGGLMRIIDIAWRLFLYTKRNKKFVVTIDEPENHLHPALQRSFLRQLVDTFPEVQFIVATHSPFMVSAVRDSFVYSLRYRDLPDEAKHSVYEREAGIHRKVYSKRMGASSKNGNAGKVLREVLGVDATIPEWVEEELAKIVENLRGRPVTSQLLDQLRDDLSDLGFSEMYPLALSKLTEGL